MNKTAKTIEVVVRSDGQSVVETKGFTGGNCLKASRFLEAALGTSQDNQRTAEFYSTAVTTNVQLGSSESRGTQLP